MEATNSRQNYVPRVIKRGQPSGGNKRTRSASGDTPTPQHPKLSLKPQEWTARRAIERGCAKAFPHPIETIAPKERTAEQRKVLETELADWRRDHRFSPHQLRHNAATRIRAEFGIDVAGSVLGHALGSQVTEIYAEPVREKAYQAILKTG